MGLTIYFIILIFSEIIIASIFFGLLFKTAKKKQLHVCFMFVLGFMFIWTFSLILQILFHNTSIPPIFFEKIASLGACYIPVAFLMLGLIFERTKLKIKWQYFLLLIIPTLSVILLATNSYHHLFYEKYSIYTKDTIFGPYFPVHSLYTFGLFGFSIFYLLRYSLKNSGFFSRQSLFIIIGLLVPLTINILGLSGVNMTVYLTPMSFTITILFFALAIFKFQFLRVTPIALQKIVDRMSDAYLVINEDNIITDFNKTFLHIFNFPATTLRNKNFLSVAQDSHFTDIDLSHLENILETVKNTTQTFHFERYLQNINKYFNIEINSILDNNNFLGTLILFKDTTQHMQDMQTIQNNTDLLMEKERLASLGQLIGGIAHNLKTPIMSIAGASEGLSDLIKEYDLSISDPEVTPEDHHAIAKDMYEWVAKIKTHTEYMSDVITAVKGQAVTFSENTNFTFTVEELVKQVNILMKHELKNALVDMNVMMKVDPKVELKGNINSLVQVINNMISNAIQAYDGKPNQLIDLMVDYNKDKSQVVISIKDYGPGLPKMVTDKLFKEMITTKGKNGTGLGLFMSYSNIRAHFNGTITFESQEGKGTTFHISLPI